MRAERSARTILQTLADDLGGFVAALDAGLSEPEALAAVEDWLLGRQTWKSRQIARTEAATAGHAVLAEFAARNALDGEARVVPDTYADDRCKALVERGWMPMGEALAFRLPVHPNCVHALELKPNPLTALRWTGA